MTQAAGHPVFLFFHGAGATGGSSKENYRKTLRAMAEKGFIAISADYRDGDAAAIVSIVTNGAS